ncbi:MAG: hypothetical protein RL235_730 [Chlamydiota bacterium]|jgi:cytochrome o ubiquinol oxidase subunit 2
MYKVEYNRFFGVPVVKRALKVALVILPFAALAALITLYLRGITIDVLSPRGLIGDREKELFVFATLLMLIVVIPVFILTIWVAWKYRASNHRGKYTPDWDYSLVAESAWWGIPFIIIVILSIVTWTSSHELDPFKPLDSNVPPMRIQVIGQQWKWLFIYPDYKIAVVNFTQFPTETPLNFELTSDAPMNSFWIPRLGSQIYAMSGMTTKVHLISQQSGDYFGCSANISGEGFSGMTFTARASSWDEFHAWVEMVKKEGVPLTYEEYDHLLAPSKYNPVAYYTLPQDDLFEHVVMKYMMPMEGTQVHD